MFLQLLDLSSLHNLYSEGTVLASRNLHSSLPNMRRRVPTAAEVEHIGGEARDDSKAKLKRNFKDASFDTSSFYSSIGALVVLALLYLPLAFLARKVMYQGFVVPLPENASLHQISAGRTLRHIYSLAKDIGVRQEGSKGLSNAAIYIRGELDALQRRAGPELRVDVDELLVSGSFNMVILRHSVALAYRDHVNLVIRISATDASDEAPSVLVNGHFDGPLGSPGAADCASCVASMLEVVRYIIDTNWVPPSPVLFLFNGAEELFLLGAHGFVTNYKAWSTVGAAINVEASGASGPDIVVQSGPGAWPSRVYAESAVFPMGNSICQDVFPHIPGDTDYRIFSQDHGAVPGLDIIFVLKGYVYHTGYDKPENIVPGSLQARGENLFALLRGFTTAPELKGYKDRASTQGSWESDPRPTFFDVFGLVMVYYPQNVARVLHILPLIVVIVVIAFTSIEELPTVSKRIKFVWQGMMLQVSGLVLATILPVALAVARLSMSKRAMTWFAQPWIAYLIYVPLAVGGLLIPRAALSAGIKRPTIGKGAQDWANHWGAVGLNALVASLFTILGVGSAYFPFWWTVFMIPALSIFRMFQRFFGERSIVSMLGYILPAALPASYTVYFGGVFIQFMTEKMGMSGTFPQPMGFYVADVIVAVITGTVTALAVSPIIPIAGNWIAKPHSLRLLIYISIGSAALSAGLFPYSVGAPKRVIFQQTVKTEGLRILESTYDFASVDPNPMSFVFVHSPEVARKLQLQLPLSEETVHFADPVPWMALFPISRLFSRGPKFPAPTATLKKVVEAFPQLHVVEVQNQDDFDSRRVHMRLDLGSLQEVWAAVINVTGPISSWSFAGGQLPAPEIGYGGPPSYICRLSGRRDKEDWYFWLETNGSNPLRIELGVLDQFLDNDAQALIDLFPSWAAVTAATSYISSYEV